MMAGEAAGMDLSNHHWTVRAAVNAAHLCAVAELAFVVTRRRPGGRLGRH
jgi:hypothetical protein